MDYAESDVFHWIWASRVPNKTRSRPSTIPTKPRPTVHQNRNSARGNGSIKRGNSDKLFILLYSIYIILLDSKWPLKIYDNVFPMLENTYFWHWLIITEYWLQSKCYGKCSKWLRTKDSTNLLIQCFYYTSRFAFTNNK